MTSKILSSVPSTLALTGRSLELGRLELLPSAIFAFRLVLYLIRGAAVWEPGVAVLRVKHALIGGDAAQGPASSPTFSLLLVLHPGARTVRIIMIMLLLPLLSQTIRPDSVRRKSDPEVYL